jgi:dihydrofolate reductase
MRKIVSFTHVSLDGYVAGPNGEMDWITYDEDMVKDARALTDNASAALYGRVTYQMMEGYWPTVPSNPNSTPEELHHAEWIENIHKVVFSRTLDKVAWNNTQLIKDNITEEVMKLKQQPGKDMLIFGSPDLTHTLARLGLVDQYRLNLNPTAIGGGAPLFETDQEKTKLKLIDSKTMPNGVIALRYEVIR